MTRPKLDKATVNIAHTALSDILIEWTNSYGRTLTNLEYLAVIHEIFSEINKTMLERMLINDTPPA